ncbi:MAG: hypothetical protein LQ352_007665 [Teloschistes flavicans]|nr:MAG: hypothetical protein LQ352_007665 [Teloschistes flavicans]
MESALDEVDNFLGPVLRKPNQPGQGQTIIQLLSTSLSTPQPSTNTNDDWYQRKVVIEKALDLLGHVYQACRSNNLDVNHIDLVTTPKNQKIISALIDLIVIEGIYPCLSHGVGIPMERRLKSALRGGFVTTQMTEDQDDKANHDRLLDTIVSRMFTMAISQSRLASSIQERAYVDLIAATSQLAFGPESNIENKSYFTDVFKTLIISKSAMDLFPLLTSLLHPSCPQWFRDSITNCLSVLPLRSNGVRQTINFIASASDSNVSSNDGQSTGPAMSLEALARASKLLTSVPSHLTPDEYLTDLAPQLLDLLDDPTADNKRIASYIVGNGILSKRKIGSPGTAGWRLFAEPVLESLNPSVKRLPVPEELLKQAVDRLAALVQFHPNPGLTKRLVGPILLPLWGLLCYALESQRAHWADQVYQILTTYMKISVTDAQLLLLGDSVMWNGTSSWIFMPGASGGVEIRQRETSKHGFNSVAEIMMMVDNRIEQFSKLLKSAFLTDDQLSKIFTHASKRWLLGSQQSRSRKILGDARDGSKDPIESLVSTKLTQKLLEDYKDRISSSIDGILQLVEPILSAFVSEHKQSVERRARSAKPSILSLSNMTGQEEAQGDEEESKETIAAALSLLSAVLTSSDPSEETNSSLITRLQDSLTYINQAQFSLDHSLTKTASNILLLLQLHLSTPPGQPTAITSNPADPYAEQRTTHRIALHHLTDPLAPVRAQGLSSLTTLISNSSPILDITSTASLLISLLQDEEEYIYLSAIKALGMLASNHPRTVMKMLVERYVDKDEEAGLDVRIKIGEALNKTVEGLGELFTGEGAVMVGSSMMAVASRRGHKPKTQRKREREQRKEAKARKEAEEAWDGEVPESSEGESEEAKIKAYIGAITSGWSDTGREEDLRVRTSALSILSTAVETNMAALGPTITSEAIDCALAILKVEKNDAQAILRRAAVMVVMSVVKAIDAAEERGVQLGFGFAGANLAEVITVLGYVEATDRDETVIGHVRAVIESLEAWRTKSLLGMSKTAERAFGLDALRSRELPSRPRIQEIE